MTTKLLCVAMLAALLVSSGFATEKMDKNFKAGTTESVKAWAPRPYDALKGGFQPMAIYIFDAGSKGNATAFHYEGAECLNNAGVKDKIAKFAKIKIKTDGTDVKGWPEAILKAAEKGASLILMSSDMTITKVFDKSVDVAGRSKEAIEAAATLIQAHEDKLKAARDKEDKKAQIAEKAKEKEIEKEKGPDLTIKLDTKKPEPPKKPGDKTKPEDAKAAGANAAAANPADPKNAAMKKGPQDE